MEDLLQLACVACFVLGTIAALGHGMWVAVAALFGWGASHKRAEEAGPLPADDLGAFRRQLDRMRAAGLIEPSAAEALLAKALATPPPTTAALQSALPAAAAALPSRLKPEAELEQLLAGYPHLADGNRQRALRIFDTLGHDACERLTPARHFDLARLLAVAGRAGDALRRYRALVDGFADHAACVPTALEAADLALRARKAGEARYFLERLDGRGLTPAQQTEAERLRESLALLTAASARVVPVDPAAVVPVPPAVLQPASSPPPAPPQAPAPPPLPRRSFGEVLAGFLEEKNIRWGELIGGLLIVASSVALVISLWEKLSRQPYLQFLVFVGGTSAVYGAGLYTHHRWRLPSTSRGLLMVATLLVPLNFLAMAGTWRELDAAALFMSGLAAAAFAGLAAMAGRILLPPARGAFVAGTLGIAATLPFLPHLATLPLPYGLALPIATALPVGLFCGALGAMLRRLRSETLDAALSTRLLTTVGAATFALVVALGLLVVPPGHVWRDLGAIAPLAALAAAALAATGLTILRESDDSSALGPVRTAATFVALGGATLLLAAVPLAWPDPGRLLVASLVCSAALAGLAWRYRLPALHAPAAATLVVAYLMAFHLLWGNIALGVPLVLRWPSADSLAQSGAALVALFAVLAGAAAGLYRRGRKGDARAAGRAAAGVAGLSLLLVTLGGYPGETNALGAAVVYGLYGAGCLGFNVRRRQPALTYAGLGLLLAATGWVLWRWDGLQVTPLWSTVLAIEVAAMAAAAIALRKSAPSSRSEAFGRPLANVATVAAPLAAALAFVPPGLDTQWPTATAALLAVAASFLAWHFRNAAWTWCGSALGLAALAHAIVWPAARGAAFVENPWTTALLAHATLAAAANVVLSWWKPRKQADAAWLLDGRESALRSVLLRPLGTSGVCSSLAALPLMLAVDSVGRLSLPLGAWALDLLWLAGLWLAVSVVNGWRGLFGGAQAALAGAILCAVAARQTGLGHEPENLLMHAAAWGLLGIVWTLVRIAVRSEAFGRWPSARRLLNGPLPGVDRRTSYAAAVLFFAAMYLAAWPGITNELAPPGAVLLRALPADPFVAAWGWAALALLAGGSILSMWDRWRIGDALSAVLLLAAVPMVVAEHVQGSLATASALRWGLAIAFFAGGAVSWMRTPLAGALARMGCRLKLRPWANPLAQALLLALTVAPLAFLTWSTARLALDGIATRGPSDGLFATLPLAWSLVLPVAFAAAALVGFAVREASPGYALAAGGAVNGAVLLGYALALPAIQPADVVRLVQLAALVSAVWAMLWLAVRRAVLTWRGREERPTAPWAMRLQLTAAVAGNVVGLLPGLLAVALLPPWWDEAGWRPAASGGVLGWLAAAATLAALVGHAWHRGRSVHSAWLGLAGMAALALLACGVDGVYGGWWGYRTLLIGWPMYAACVALATWWVAEQRTRPGEDGPPLDLVWTASLWVRLAGTAGLLLAGQAVAAYALRGISRDELAWAAAAIALAGLAGAAMAVWRKADGWAFSSGMGANLAASLLVWRSHADASWELWWSALVQANLVAFAGVALLWLAARRRWTNERPLAATRSPLLQLQVALALGNVAMLLAIPVALLVFDPPLAASANRQVVSQLGNAASWLGLALSAAAAGWRFRQTSPARPWYGAAALLAGAAFLAACVAARNAATPWLAFQTLVFAPLAAAAALTLLARYGGGLLRGIGRWRGNAGSISETPSEKYAGSTAGDWSTVLACAAAALAVRAVWHDTDQHEWAAIAALLATVQVALAAMLLGGGARVNLSGGLVHVAGTLLWFGRWDGVWRTPDVAELLRINALCAAAGGLLWLLLGSLARRESTSRGFGLARISRYPAVALVGGTALLGAVAALGIGVDLVAVGPLVVSTSLAGLAFGLLGALAALLGRRHGSPESAAGAYAVGIVGEALLLDGHAARPAELALWTAGLLVVFLPAASAVAAYVLSAPRWLTRAATPEARQEQLPAHGSWFVAGQAALALLAVALGTWVSLDFASHPATWPRLVGCAAIAATAASGLLLLTRTRGSWRAAIQLSLLVLPPLALAEFLWTLVRPLDAAPLLHPAAALLGCCAAAIAFIAWRLYAPLAASAAWSAAIRRALPVLATIGAVALGYALWHEVLLFPEVGAKPRGAPLNRWLLAFGGAALAGLAVTAVRLAVTPARDPYRLSERGRQAYVYAAELLAVLCWLHVYLCVPKLIPVAIMDKWWTVIVMLIAFGGAALSEFFQRRRMPTLSLPLARTAAALPCLPLLLSLDVLPLGEFWQQYRDHLRMPYWTLLFLVGGFYAWLAYARRSITAGVLAIVATNAGLWWLLEEQGLKFLEYPHYWLIPPALLALVAEYLNRSRLSPAAAGGIRYFALSVIYLSTTVDMFRDGLARSMPWGPVLLTLLSIAGIMAGMLLRVRSFLLLGTAFLLLTLVTMVYYASFDQGYWWVLYASGIGLGAAILVLFGLFEKRRHELLDAVGKLKQWER